MSEEIERNEDNKPKRGRSREEMVKMPLQSRLPTIRRRELVKRIETLVLTGVKRSEILQVVKNEFGLDDPIYVTNFITEARRNIIRMTSTSMDEIKDLHVFYYEKIFNYFDSIGYSLGKAKALQYKERLLGHHREDTFIEVNNENNVEIEISNEELYDISVLDPKEKHRIQYLRWKLDDGLSNERRKVRLRKRNRKKK
jgi:hypothetical protein